MAQLSGLGAAYVTGGVILAWSGIKNTTLQATLSAFLQGKLPQPNPTGSPAVGLQQAGGSGSSGASSPGGAGTYSQAQIEQLWISSGGDPSKARLASAIAEAESGGRTGVTSSNPDGGTNVGLWQLDTKGAGSGYTVAQLQNPQTNAHVTIMQSKNGTSWGQWETYVTGAYQRFM